MASAARTDQPRARGRTLTVLAVGCLALDGILLLLAGYWGRRVGLLLGGLVCLLAGILVLGWRRRYLRALREIEATRSAAAAEARALGRLLRDANKAGG
jgi:hypothetical protein